MTYTDVFGGGVVNPTDTAFIPYTISANLTLVWPIEQADSTNIAPAEIDINATVGGLSVTLPDATQVSVGQTVYLKNVGANAFNLLKSDSTLISSIATTTTYIVQLTDNTTPAGVWAVTAVGTSTPAVASALAGPGLTPYGVNQLATAHPVDDKSSTPYNVLTTDRASLLNWTGGAGMYVLPSAATAGDNFFILVRNSGTGILTLSAADDIDENATKVYSIGESSFVCCDGVTYYTVGYGQSDLNAISYLSISITGSGTYTLSAAESVYSILDLTGALSGDRTIVFPSGASARWFVRNNTTGSYSVSLTVDGSGSTIDLPAGQNITIWSDATTARNAVTFVPTQAGKVDWFIGTTAPDGYVIAGGGTIGSAASAATARANSDTAALYAVLWNACPDTICPVSTGRGGSAAADFAANKTLTLLDLRGRSIVGLDNAGGTAANVSQVTTNLTTNGTNTATVASAANLSTGMYVINSNVAAGTTITAISGTTLTLSGAATGSGTTSGRFSFFTDAQQVGASGGALTHTLSTAQLASHAHAGVGGSVFAMNFLGTVQSGAGASVPQLANAQNATASAGSDQPHANLQPSMIALPCLKL